MCPKDWTIVEARQFTEVGLEYHGSRFKTKQNKRKEKGFVYLTV